MTTSEQARAWAKAEAEKRYPPHAFVEGVPYIDPAQAATRRVFEAGVLHVLSLLESETAVEAAAAAIRETAAVTYHPSTTFRLRYRDRGKRVLAAAVAAITGGGSENG